MSISGYKLKLEDNVFTTLPTILRLKHRAQEGGNRGINSRRQSEMKELRYGGEKKEKRKTLQRKPMPSKALSHTVNGKATNGDIVASFSRKTVDFKPFF